MILFPDENPKYDLTMGNENGEFFVEWKIHDDELAEKLREYGIKRINRVVKDGQIEIMAYHLQLGILFEQVDGYTMEAIKILKEQGLK